MADLQTQTTVDGGLADPPTDASTDAGALVDQVARVVLGNPEPIRLAVTAFFAGSHILVEDMPGVGKTLLAKALAKAIGGSFGRVQGTADLLPSDVTGVSVFEPSTGAWTFRAGPIFHNVVLFDELNRATPRTQSALLEAMAEGQTTVDGTTRELPEPFFVVATQNPHGDLGTFPLLHGQRDRFGMVLSLGLIEPEVERHLLGGVGGTAELDKVGPVIDLTRWPSVSAGVDAVYVNDAIRDYIIALASALRDHPEGRLGISPRATLTLLRTARAYAITHGRDFVEPDDVKAVAIAVLAHRIGDPTVLDLPRARATIVDLLGHVPVPPPG